ncbi:MAG: hypothetical protein KAS57_07235 [Gammaproteobacteria bacterium]|nr:hypothetical protein [Gammaproteobacteria bacterium]
MSSLTQFWLQRMTAFANASRPLYYIFLWLLVIMGVSFLLLFPLVALLSFGWMALLVYMENPMSWQQDDWILAVSLLASTGYSSWVSIYLFKMRPELPAGKPLDKKIFPVLADRINELCTTYQSPEFPNVKLSTRFRIELVRTPANGFPTNLTNTLLIGLPVMSCMSPLQFKLLLARQIGHLTRKNRSYSRPLVHLRNIWNGYAQHYAQAWRPETILLRLFFSWFAPFFYLSSIAAVRFEAFAKDQLLMEITPAASAAEAISVFEIKKRYLSINFWPKLNDAAYASAKPPYLPYSSMATIMSKVLDHDTDYAQNCYEAAINREVLISSELPNLMKRLTAIGFEDFIMPEPNDEKAAHHFLGEHQKDLLKQMDNIWYLKNKAIWSKRYKQGVEERRRLKVLREQAAQALLSNSEAREYLLLIDKYIDAKKALPLFKEIVKTNSMDAEVCYELGRLLLEADDSSGVHALKIAMDTDPSKTPDSCQHIVSYMAKHGQVQEAQHYRRMILEHQANH